MPNDGAVRIGIAGAGRIGRRHAELIWASPECVLVGVADPVRSEDPPAFAQVPWYHDVGDLLAQPGLDGVIIATPSAMHLDHGLACIAAGIPCLIEKPIATTVADGLTLADAAEDRGLALLVGHHRRHSAHIAAAAEAIRTGTIGEVVAVSGTALFFKPSDYFAAAAWRTQPGGGPILINLVHEVDDLRAMCGEIVRVQATASHAIRGYSVEDTAAVIFEFASGALGTFLISDAAAAPWSWEQTSGEDAGYAQYGAEDCYLISGTRGSIAVPTLRVWTVSGEPTWHRSMTPSVMEPAVVDPLARQLAHFCAVIRGEATPFVTAQDAVETLRVTVAVEEAARSGAAVATIPDRPGTTPTA